MELTRQVLDDVKFETKGRWYNADQVDEFLEELAESVEQAQAEVARLRQEVRGLNPHGAGGKKPARAPPRL